MGVGKGQWISMAAEASEWLVGKSPTVRRQLMEQHHRRGGPPPHSLQRMLVALEYLVSIAKNSGVDLADVVASYAAVEALSRIDRLEFVEATALSRDVLLGKIGVRQLAKILSRIREKKARDETAERPGRWRVYWEETLIVLSSLGPGNFSAEITGHSQRARSLLVDLEFFADSGKTAAIFLSPLCGFSSFTKRPLIDQLPRVLTALAYYDHVYYISYEPIERSVIDTWLNEGDWGGKTIHFEDPVPWDIELVEP